MALQQAASPLPVEQLLLLLKGHRGPTRLHCSQLSTQLAGGLQADASVPFLGTSPFEGQGQHPAGAQPTLQMRFAAAPGTTTSSSSHWRLPGAAHRWSEKADTVCKF